MRLFSCSVIAFNQGLMVTAKEMKVDIFDLQAHCANDAIAIFVEHYARRLTAASVVDQIR